MSTIPVVMITANHYSRTPSPSWRSSRVAVAIVHSPKSAIVAVAFGRRDAHAVTVDAAEPESAVLPGALQQMSPALACEDADRAGDVV